MNCCLKIGHRSEECLPALCRRVTTQEKFNSSSAVGSIKILIKNFMLQAVVVVASPVVRRTPLERRITFIVQCIYEQWLNGFLRRNFSKKIFKIIEHVFEKRKDISEKIYRFRSPRFNYSISYRGANSNIFDKPHAGAVK